MNTEDCYNSHRLLSEFLIVVILAAVTGQTWADSEPKTATVFAVGKEAVRGDQGKAYAQFREQNVIVTDSGAVVVICQGRNKSKWSDRSGQDLVVKTSRDCGKTWGSAKLVVTQGRKSICPNAAVYDRRTGRIHVLYNLFMWT